MGPEVVPAANAEAALINDEGSCSGPGAAEGAGKGGAPSGGGSAFPSSCLSFSLSSSFSFLSRLEADAMLTSSTLR